MLCTLFTVSYAATVRNVVDDCMADSKIDGRAALCVAAHFLVNSVITVFGSVLFQVRI